VSFQSCNVGEFTNRDARHVDRVLKAAYVSVSNRHAAGDYLTVVDRQMPANNQVILGQENLWAGIEASGLRRKHESLSEKPAVEPAAYFQSPVHREKGGNRRIKKIRLRAVWRPRASISVRSMPSAA
jgi:hypothetical protein